MTQFLVHGYKLLLVSQGSILGPFLYYCRETTENVVKNLQSELKIVLKWFRNNQMMVNFGKFQYMLLGKHTSLKIEIEGFQLESAKPVNLFGITIGYNLTFDTHISNTCKRASPAVKNLSRIRNALNKKRVKLLYNSFILSQFNYCSIIWIFCSKISCKKLNKYEKDVYE